MTQGSFEKKCIDKISNKQQMKFKLDKKQKRALTFPFRIASSSLRCLPDFIIIGAPKCGTSSLYYYLSQHPQIKPCIKKEINFFNAGKDPHVDDYAKGLSWYRAFFPLDLRRQHRFFTGEASTLYMFSPLVPERIHKHLPGIKLIALLRDPITRAHSQYFHELRKGRESLSMLDAFLAEESRISKALKAKDYKSPDLLNYSYLKKGLYAEQLERYLEYFSRDQILVLQSETFFEKTHEVMKLVWDFIGVDQNFFVPDLTTKQKGKNKKNMSPDVLNYLRSYYNEPNQRLFELLGRSFNWN